MVAVVRTEQFVILLLLGPVYLDGRDRDANRKFFGVSLCGENVRQRRSTPSMIGRQHGKYRILYMPAKGKTPLNLNIKPDMLARIDKFRFKRMFATRTEAIEFLLDPH